MSAAFSDSIRWRTTCNGPNIRPLSFTSMRTQTCPITNENFKVSDQEQQLLARLGFNLPQVAPAERLRALLSFRGGRRLYRRNCQLSGEPILSIYPPAAQFPVFSPALWWDSHERRAQLKKTYTPDVSFFIQLYELWNIVPRPAVTAMNCAQSTAVDNSASVSNSLLISDSYQVDRCSYGAFLLRCTVCADCLFCSDCSRCYDCAGCSNCTGLGWSDNCFDCSGGAFLSGCVGCSNCYCCSNLTGAENCLFNRQATAEEIARFISEYKLHTPATDRRLVDELREQSAIDKRGMKVPARWSDDQSLGTGNYLIRSSAEDSYFVSDSTELFHCFGLHQSAGCIDSIGFGGKLSDSYQAVGCSGSRILSSISCGDCRDIWYSSHCFDCSHLVGCVGLIGREYCILNQQYTAEQFGEIRDYIAETLHMRNIWGAFFTSTFAGIHYNGSQAQEFMPLSEIQAELLQFDWDQELDAAVVPTEANDPPATLTAAAGADEQGVLEKTAMICEITGRLFRLSRLEYELYRELCVPPPARCFEQRHSERLKRCFAGRLYSVTSAATGQNIVSASPPSAKVSIVEREQWKQSLISPACGA